MNISEETRIVHSSGCRKGYLGVIGSFLLRRNLHNSIFIKHNIDNECKCQILSLIYPILHRHYHLNIYRTRTQAHGNSIYLEISNSLIIHDKNTKEIKTETEFGYVIKHLHKIKATFISIFSLNTDLFEMLDQTLGRVFHQDIQTPRRC